MRVSAVIPTLNGRGLLAACLAALFAGERVPDEIIVVDNGSTDGTIAWLAETYPRVIVVQCAANLGFASANNVGIHRATGDAIFTLNNDANVTPGALAALVAALDTAGERCGTAMATMVFAHRPEIVANAGIVFSRDGVAREIGVGEPYDATLPPFPIFGPSAGAALYRRAALHDVGLFDPAFFLYLEDADLAWRLRLRRWETVSVPAARVTHAYSATAGHGSARKAYYLARNRAWCLGKNLPDTLLRCHAVALATYDAAAVAFALATGDGASLAGRRQAFAERTAILHARARVQARVTADTDALDAWLASPLSPVATLRERGRIAVLVAAQSG